MGYLFTAEENRANGNDDDDDASDRSDEDDSAGSDQSVGSQPGDQRGASEHSKQVREGVGSLFDAIKEDRAF